MRYKAEFFTKDFGFVDYAAIETPRIKNDALTLENSTLTLNGDHKSIKKGHMVSVTSIEGDEEFQGFVEKVEPQTGKTQVVCKPLTSILDVNVMFDRTESHHIETFLAGITEAYYVDNEDTLQNVTGMTVSADTDTIGYLNLKINTGNLYEIMTKALKLYGIWCKMSFDAKEKKFDVKFQKVTDVMTIEADLPIVLEKTVKIGDSGGGLNKITIINADDEEERMTFFRHTDGTIDDTDADRIVPVEFDTQTLQQEEGSGQTFEESAYAKAYEALKENEYANEITLLYQRGNGVVPKELRIGTAGNILLGDKAYRSVLTGIEKTEGTVRMYFGYLRSELTKKLILQRRKNE